MIGAYVELARAHAPLLMVSVAFGAAALAMLSPPRLSWFIACAGALVSAVFAFDLAWRLLAGGGAFAFLLEGVALETDGVSVFGAALVSLTGVLALLAAGAQLGDFERRTASVATALGLAVQTAWIGALAARDLIGVFVAAETAWLAAAALLALSAERGALNGALRMLSAGGVGAALFLVGAALIHRSAGTLDLPAIAEAHIEAADAAALGAGLIVLSLALKAGVAPLHDWLGAGFSRANGAAAMIVGAAAVVGALTVLVRVAAYFVQAPAIGEGVSIALAVLGGASVVIGSLQAVGATNVRRLAAYAGAAQAGGVLLCVALGSPAGVAAALVQLTALAATALALFGGAAAGGVRTLEGLDGLGRRAPLAGAAMMAGAISLMGAPLTLGFLGRWRLVEAGVGAGWWWAAGAVIFASLAGVFYGGRLIERLYFRRAGEIYLGGAGAWRFAAAPLLLAAIVMTALGVAPGLLLDAADAAAAQILGAAA
ncbi:MAG TPA: proton-conducting transporter membrane subunit [Vitreimonas sp.]|uniref:proton-conducting transporter transmembrane domain-containing protein n=1 Tax=Vitreimonas sp. TaxID=3069702 RepID=UPI002D3BA089|nr:proton-conducting transporter membrane subunit [Vitreimonas sp.]HYD89161.1 proton-conducting transporter membrane subunit [Vitreimonas sp.]